VRAAKAGGVTMLDAACDYAGRGWRVHPLHDCTAGACSCGTACGKNAGKHPRLHDWPHVATTDPAQLARWLSRWPTANLAVVTGAESKLVVLDADGDLGAESLRHLERRHGAFPETVVSLTGRGGRHFLYRHPGVRVGNLVGRWPGIDPRGDGGFIVVPPSRTVGTYAWQIGSEPGSVPVAEMPAWLLEQLGQHPRERLRADGTPLVLREGERNCRIFQIGSALRRYGLGEQALCDALEAINRVHCVPLLEAAEVAKIAASATRYPPPARCDTCGAPLPQDEERTATAHDEDALVARALGVVR
jgi:putative DNA primase/helicase